MNDPQRLLDGGAGSLAAELLSAGAEETPAPEVSRRALHAVLAAAGVSAVAASSSAASLPAEAAATAAKLSAAPAASGVTAVAKSTLLTSAAVKWIGVGVVGLSAAGSAPRAWQWAAGVEVPRASTMASAPAVRQPLAPPAAPAQAPAPPAAGPEVPPATRSPAPDAPRPRKRAPTPPTLSDELARVDRARALLQRGDAAGALRELVHYEAEFPRRQLGLEVAMLRMEAALRAGQMERARELAQQVLASGASPAHTARARAVLLELAALENP